MKYIGKIGSVRILLSIVCVNRQNKCTVGKHIIDIHDPLCDYMDYATGVDVRNRATVADDFYGDGSHDDMDADVQTESERFPVHYYNVSKMYVIRKLF
jgi:hypothetical protein